MRRAARFTILVPTLCLAFSGAVHAAKPAAQYWMSVSTENMSIPGMEAEAGAGVEGMMGSMMMKGMGVGGGPNRTMWLDLLGPDTPPSPSADHFIPPGLKMGESVRTGQPRVLDTARMSADDYGSCMMATGGSEQRKEVVIWTSSELQDMGGGLMTYLPNGMVQKYIAQKVVMKPDTTRCSIPKGIFQKYDGAAVQFIAYGDEANFAYPPRPADPKAKWEPIWTAKVRLKSMGMLPLGAEAAGKAEKPKEEASPVDSAVGVKKLKGLFGF